MSRRGYHHGNLKEALVEATLELIAEAGPDGFTLAEAARLAGVTPAALYRHFRDRADLMAEVARRGFELFAEALEKAWAGGRPSPLAAFDAVGRAYLAFARAEPAYYAAMFAQGSASLLGPGSPGSPGARAFAVLGEACTQLARRLPPERRPPVAMMAYHVWALAHGVAQLFLARAGEPPRAPMTPEDLLESGTGIYLRGLGLIPADG